MSEEKNLTVQENEKKLTMPENEKNFIRILNAPQTQRRLEAVLQKNSPAFISALMAVFRGNKQLQECDPQSVLNAAMDAANNNLMVGGTLGHAYILPYGKKATLIISYKGLIQLAIRSGLVKTINTGVYREGEVRLNKVTGKLIEGKQTSTAKVYVAYIELTDGFTKAMMMTGEEVRAYAQKYSASYRNKKDIWRTNFDEMAEKTVLRRLLVKYAPLSVAAATSSFDDTERESEEFNPAEEYIDGETIENSGFVQSDGVSDIPNNES